MSHNYIIRIIFLLKQKPEKICDSDKKVLMKDDQKTSMKKNQSFIVYGWKKPLKSQ